MLFPTREGNRFWDWVLLGFVSVISAAVLWPAYLTPQKTFFYLMLVTMIGLNGYIFYSIWAIHNLTYEVGRDAITIHYGYKKITIPYQNIQTMEVIGRASLNRLVGNQYPGTYCGYFTEGKEKRAALVYATDKKDLIKITTSTLNYYVSPRDTRYFLDKTKTCWAEPHHPELHTSVTERTSIWLSWEGLLLLGLNIIALALVAVFIHHLAGTIDQMPMHYNLRGEVDRYGSPSELYVMLLISIVILPIIIVISDMLIRYGVPKREAVSILWIPLALTVFMGVVIMSMV